MWCGVLILPTFSSVFKKKKYKAERVTWKNVYSQSTWNTCVISWDWLFYFYFYFVFIEENQFSKSNWHTYTYLPLSCKRRCVFHFTAVKRRRIISTLLFKNEIVVQHNLQTYLTCYIVSATWKNHKYNTFLLFKISKLKTWYLSHLIDTYIFQKTAPN